jgi:hypothetical protein
VPTKWRGLDSSSGLSWSRQSQTAMTRVFASNADWLSMDGIRMMTHDMNMQSGVQNVHMSEAMLPLGRAHLNFCSPPNRIKMLFDILVPDHNPLIKSFKCLQSQRSLSKCQELG